eukprot:COSAG04_NODE_94_length_26569_cov_27.995127_10_plen_66_part_00
MSSMAMQILLSFQPVSNWLVRGALNSLVPLIAADQGFSDAERGMLLASFFPGCEAGSAPSLGHPG